MYISAEATGNIYNWFTFVVKSPDSPAHHFYCENFRSIKESDAKMYHCLSLFNRSSNSSRLPRWSNQPPTLHITLKMKMCLSVWMQHISGDYQDPFFMTFEEHSGIYKQTENAAKERIRARMHVLEPSKSECIVCSSCHWMAKMTLWSLYDLSPSQPTVQSSELLSKIKP